MLKIWGIFSYMIRIDWNCESWSCQWIYWPFFVLLSFCSSRLLFTWIQIWFTDFGSWVTIMALKKQEMCRCVSYFYSIWSFSEVKSSEKPKWIRHSVSSRQTVNFHNFIVMALSIIVWKWVIIRFIPIFEFKLFFLFSPPN